jgi:hypothetical protein
MEDISTLISTVGYPIVSAVAMFFGCKYMLDQQQKNTDRMFSMYEQSNTENREAIKACTEAINRLCDRLDKEV